MKRKRAIVLAVVAVLVLLAAVYLWGPASAPSGQEPLFVLSGANFHEFENAFDAQTDGARLVLLLSPT
jgi:hypothetical protein